MKFSLRNISFSLLLLLVSYINLKAQKSAESAIAKSKSHLFSAGAEIPIGNFSNTHLPGIGIEYSGSKNRFGIFSAADIKKIAFVYSSGAAIYFGRKEVVSLYPYKYPAYIFIKTNAGVLYKTGAQSGVTISAGPAMGIYNGNTRFNLNSKLEGHYFLNEKLAITPGIILQKEISVANLLISVSIKASLAF